MENIWATLNSHIQALKLYIYYYIDIYLKVVILALSWGVRKLNACKNYQLYSKGILCFLTPPNLTTRISLHILAGFSAHKKWLTK